jgi:hypothetical protein
MGSEIQINICSLFFKISLRVLSPGMKYSSVTVTGNILQLFATWMCLVSPPIFSCNCPSVRGFYTKTLNFKCPRRQQQGARISGDLAGQAMSPKLETTRPRNTVLQQSIGLLSLYVVELSFETKRPPPNRQQLNLTSSASFDSVLKLGSPWICLFACQGDHSRDVIFRN